MAVIDAGIPTFSIWQAEKCSELPFLHQFFIYFPSENGLHDASISSYQTSLVTDRASPSSSYEIPF